MAARYPTITSSVIDAPHRLIHGQHAWRDRVNYTASSHEGSSTGHDCSIAAWNETDPELEFRPASGAPLSPKESVMLFHPSPYLRQGLLSNATTNVGLSLFMMLATGLLTRRLGLPSPLLLIAGVAYMNWGLVLGTLALRQSVSRAHVRAVIGFNVAWALASILAVAAMPSATRPGLALVLAQAGCALMYAALQQIGLQRSSVQST
jgi:hypothetical protein